MLTVAFKIGDEHIICPECGSPNFWPRIDLVKKQVQWWSVCQDYYFIKERYHE